MLSSTFAHSTGGVAARERVPRARADFRPEIQALRALAVLSVIAFHFWPSRVPGGYVGVDIFFVISGYLIVGHLLREVEKSRRIDLLGFWARRARRLLPASLLVLTVTAITVVVWVPRVNWVQYLGEIGDSAIYIQNWRLAFDAVDYLAAANAPSPVQHFWSLSVEEQFYIVVPLLIVVVLAALRVAQRLSFARQAMGLLLLGLTVAGFAHSVYLTATDPAFAYFATSTRAWEFTAGGLLAWMLGRHTVGNRAVASMVSWGGCALIGFSLFAYTSDTAFPGYAAAIPVVGSAMVVAGGLPLLRWSPSSFFRLRPVQWVGDISYSLYLWHWPFLIVLPFMLGHALDNIERVALIPAVFVIAWASKRFVEDRFRFPLMRLNPRSWRVVLVAVVVSSVFLAASVIATSTLQARIDETRAETLQLLDKGSSCLGAAAFGPGITCPRPFAVTELSDPAIASQDIGKGVRGDDECKQTLEDSTVLTCELGDLDSPEHTIALVGDSHAGQYLEPLEIYAKHNSWKVITYLKTWCIGTGRPEVAAPDSLSEVGVRSCTDWGNGVLDQITNDPEIDAVVFSNYTLLYSKGINRLVGRAVTESDFEDAWSRIEKAGKKVIVLRDLPNMAGVSAPTCVSQHLSEYDPCSTPITAATPADDPQWAAVTADPAVGGVDMSRYLCDANRCHTVIGGLIVYFDSHHLSATYARTLAPFLGAAIAAELQTAGRG